MNELNSYYNQVNVSSRERVPSQEEAPQKEEIPLMEELVSLKEKPDSMHHLLNLISNIPF
jgi:hypothetical protein